MTVSVVIPVLNDAAALARCLAALRPEAETRRRGDAENIELVVVDGGPDDTCRVLSEKFQATYLVAQRGRARQMNAGAAAATGTWLWFLHADSIPPRDAVESIQQLNEMSEWGCFRHRIDAPAFGLRIIEAADNFRARWFGMPYGDQGFFVRRDVFEAVGGFPDEPQLEDVILARMLRRRSRPKVLAPTLRTDPRRWLERGILSTTLTNWRIMWLYLVAKRTPAELERIYRESPAPVVSPGGAEDHSPGRQPWVGATDKK